jgi:hypothetical protein
MVTVPAFFSIYKFAPHSSNGISLAYEGSYLQVEMGNRHFCARLASTCPRELSVVGIWESSERWWGCPRTWGAIGWSPKEKGVGGPPGRGQAHAPTLTFYHKFSRESKGAR